LIDSIISEDIETITRGLNQAFFEGKKALVTGGAGFLGSYLCDVLVKLKADVTCLDNFSTGIDANVDHLAKAENFRVINCNVSTFMTDQTFDYFFHFASRVSPEDYQLHPIDTLLTNSLGSHRMLELALRSKSRIILASTSEVYGDPKTIPTPEDYWGNVNPVGIRSCYDEGKRFSEALFMAYNREYKLNMRIARIHNTYGPRMRGDGAYARALPRFILQAMKGDDITVYGDGLQTRSFTYVSDTIRGILSAFYSNKTRGEVFNIGNPQETTILDLAKKIKEAINDNASIKFCPLPADDPKRRRPDIKRAKNILYWYPKVGLDQGLLRTIEWFRRQKTNLQTTKGKKPAHAGTQARFVT
jgi:UDP-glucuronate decarboxylase